MRSHARRRHEPQDLLRRVPLPGRVHTRGQRFRPGSSSTGSFQNGLFIKLGRNFTPRGGRPNGRSFTCATWPTPRAHHGDGIPGRLPYLNESVVSVRDLVQLICDRMKARFEDCVESWASAWERIPLIDWTASSCAAARLEGPDLAGEGIDETIAWVEHWCRS